MARTCVTYKLACMTRKAFDAFARLAFGLSKKSFTSAKVACLKPAPPYSAGSVEDCMLGFLRRNGAGACMSADMIRVCNERTSSRRAVAK